MVRIDGLNPLIPDQQLASLVFKRSTCVHLKGCRSLLNFHAILRATSRTAERLVDPRKSKYPCRRYRGRIYSIGFGAVYGSM